MARFKIWKYKDNWYLYDKQTTKVYKSLTWGMALIFASDIVMENGQCMTMKW